MSEIDDLIAAGEALRLQREAAIELHLEGQHDQSTHGNWAAEGDLAAKQSVNVGDIIRFVPEGGQRAVTIKVTGKDRGRGGGISGQRVVDGKVKPGINKYQTPAAAGITKVNAEGGVEQRIGTMKERIAEKTRLAVEAKAKAREAGIRAAQEAIAARAKPAVGTPEYEEALRKQREELLGPRKAAEMEQMEKVRAAVQAEAAKRDAEIKAAEYEPTKVSRSLRWGGTFKMTEASQQGAIEGADAIEQAGLKGDYGNISVEQDEPGNTRYGGYYSGQNRIVLSSQISEDYAAFTFAHEYGHHVDKFEARRTGGKDHSVSAGFKKALRETQGFRDLTNDYADAKSQGRYGYVNGRNRQRLAYLLKPTELFARAFAQWTAMKTGHPGLNNTLSARRADHWNAQDFAPLFDYFERNFGERKVRTAAGAKRYGQSIGEVIAADEEE